MSHFATLLLLFFSSVIAIAGPSKTTYQAKIIKPNGLPLEATSVGFQFTILDPTGSCRLYSESYSSVNMSSTGGLISFSLGSGIKSFPASSTTFEQVFSNITPNMACDTGGGAPAVYTPMANDARKVVMQFNDGTGWQTLPAMNINAVPYAMYANDAQKFNGLEVSDFVQMSILPACGVSDAITYNGSSFSCVATGGGSGGGVTSGSVITALGYTPADGASLTTVTANLSQVSSTVFSVSSTVSSLSSSVSSLQSSVAASFASMTSSQWVTSGASLFYNAGYVGIGTTSAVTALDVSGGVRVSFEAATCATSFAGTIRYNAGAIEYCNGSAWTALGVSGAGLTLLNGSASNTQTFQFGTAGTAPAIDTAGGVHTFNIPLASVGAVTAGLLSNADYINFSNKASSVSVTNVTTHLTTVSNTVTTLANQTAVSFANLTSAVSAITSSQWTTAGSHIFFTGGDVGVGTNTPLAKLSVDGDGLTPNTPAPGTVATFDNESADVALGLFTSSVRKANVYFGVTGAASRGALSYQFNASASNDQMRFDTNGQTRLTIVGSGTVGIGTGTAVPNAMLQIQNSDLSQNVLTLKGAPSQSAHWLNLTDSGNVTRAYITPNGGMPSLRLGVTNVIGLTSEYGGVGEIPAGASLHASGNLGIFSGNGTVGAKVMAGYFNQTSFLSAWEFVNPASGFGNLLLMKSGGNVGIGVTAPSARLHLASGSTTVAPLKFTSGTLLASPQSGTVEYDGFNFYLTNANNTRRAIATTANPGTFDNAALLTNASGDIVMQPNAGAGSVVVSSTLASTNSSNGALVVQGGAGIAGNLNVAGSISGSARVLATGFRADQGAPNATDNSTNGYAFGADGDTGMFSPGPALGNNGVVAFFSNDVERMRVHTTGNVGIGTTNPGDKLHVVSGNIIIENTPSVSYASGIKFKNMTHKHYTAGVKGNQFVIADTSTTDSTWSGAVDRFTINNLGSVGIGTMSPFSRLHVYTGNASASTFVAVNTTAMLEDDDYALLDLATAKTGLAGVRFNAGSDTTGSVFYYGPTNVNGERMAMFVSGTEKLSILPNGNVGVGINTPAVKFQVSGGDLAVTASDYPALYTVNTSKVNGTYGRTWGWMNYGGGLFLNGYASVDNNLAPGAPVTAMYVKDTSGNIGIGTTDVDAKLRVVGKIKAGTETDVVSANLNPDFNDVFELVSPNAVSAPAIAFHRRGLHTIQLGSWGTSVSQQGLLIKSGPSEAAAQLQVQSHISSLAGNIHTNRGRLALSNTATDRNHTIYNNLNNNDGEGVWDGMKMNVYHGLSVRVGQSNSATPTTALHIDAAANVGFGTTSPTAKVNIGGLGAANATALRIDSQDTYYRDIFISEFNTTAYGGILRYNSGSDLLQLITLENGVEKYGVAVARATGFVGLGMNSAAQYQLDVAGDIRITGTPYRAGGDIAWTVPSDARLKDVVRGYNRGLNELLNIDTIIYRYKNGNVKDIDPEKEFSGVLAQQVQKQIPEAVTMDKDGFLSLNTTPIFWAMVNAIKDLYYEITGVQREIASLKEDNKAKEQEIKELKERLDRIEKSLNQKN